MGMKRPISATGVALLLTLIVAAPALAAAPGNDTYAGAVVIGSLPYSDTVDTTEATTDADDQEVNVNCGAPATDASVWYEFTSAADIGVVIDVSGSDYTAGVAVVTGSPGSFELITCGPNAVGFFAEAGVTYRILAFDDQLDGGGNGGTLEIVVMEAPPAPEIDVTVDPVGSFDPRTGSATITGTVTCEGEVEFAFVEVELSQRVGRFIIRGFGGSEVTCDGTTQEWSVEVFGENGLFKGGKAVSVTFAVACGTFDCGIDFEETIVRLRR